MARPKSKTVSKFGGTEYLGSVTEENAKDAPVDNVNYDLQSLEVQSKTHLEDDQGGGGAAIIRMFEFGMNPLAFHQYKPTKQELFNSHYKGIELALWRDGMKVIPEVNPRITVDDKNGRYRIFVGAQPMKGHLLKEQPKTLTELVNSKL